jgi:WD40 repeat protein
MFWLQGHKKDGRAVAYLPDGRIASGGSDRTVGVWDDLAPCPGVSAVSGPFLGPFLACSIMRASARTREGSNQRL